MAFTSRKRRTMRPPQTNPYYLKKERKRRRSKVKMMIRPLIVDACLVRMMEMIKVGT